jgi:signal transduction histidine kinase/ActR/RegA family two-component response regulator
VPYPQLSLRSRLLALALACTIPVALCAAAALFMLLRSEENNALDRARQTNRQTAIAVEVTLNRSFAVLSAMAQSPLLDTDNLDAYNDLLNRTLPLMPGWRSLLIATPDGHVVKRVSPHEGTAPTGPTEPSSFASMLENPRPIVGQLGKGPSGTWAIPLRIPVVRDGTLKYVLTAPLMTSSIEEVLSLSNLPPGWTVGVFDTNGRRIARMPSASLATGDLIAPDVFAMVEAGGNEGSGVKRTLDGTETYTAYLRLPAFGWTVATAIPTAEVATKVANAALLYGSGLLLSLLIASGGALIFARRISGPIAELRGAAFALGQGKMPQPLRTQIVEINDVHLALQDSGITLKQSQQTREEALADLGKANDALIEADLRKDAYIATLAHELRNPLVPIRQATALLQRTDNEADRASCLNLIQQQTDHMRRLLDDLFDVSRTTQGKVALRLEQVELVTTLQDSLSFIATSAAQKRLKLTDVLPEFPLYIEGDRLRLQQVFTNLLDNAVKYTPPGGSIHVLVRCVDSQVEIDIADSGIGIPDDKFEGIFEMFRQLAPTGFESGGLGVGLALARDLVQRHNGRISVDSGGLGQGSIFTVSFPLSAHQAQPVQPGLPEPASTNLTRRIVVADDNHDIVFVMQALLESEGHVVRVAYNGQEAVSLCREEMPEVGLFDIGMPELNGLQAAQAVRGLPGGDAAFLVAISGWGRAEDVENATRAGFDRHLVKPANVDELLRLVARAGRDV